MNDVQIRSGPRWSLIKVVTTSVAAVGIGASLYVMVSAAAKPQPTHALIDLRKGAMNKLEVPGYPRPRDVRMPGRDPGVSPPAAPAPDIAFTGPDGKSVRIKDLKGKVVVLNLWATWCAPCKVEMPTLAKLAAAYQAQPVQVVALSADSPDKAAEAKAFIARNPPLKPYLSGGSTILFKFQPSVAGLPSTIIYDKKGVERARISGDADWSSKEARAVVARLLAEKG
jgi:thiol-disulfide isomerase/thioredoxin